MTSLYVRFTYVDINVFAGFDNCFFKLIVVYSVRDTEKFNAIMTIVKRLFISPPTTTLSFSSMILFTIFGFFKTLIALLVISNKFILSDTLLDLENREISQLKANQNMYRLLDTSSPYGCTHGTRSTKILHKI